MKNEKLRTKDIVLETITAMAVLLFAGLQIYYCVLYRTPFMTLVFHILPMALIYAGMLVMQRFPELLNGKNSEPLSGRVRMYAVRMVRWCKLLLALGLLVPTVGDVLGGGIDPAYSIFIMAGILGVIAYYLYRIYRNNSDSKK